MFEEVIGRIDAANREDPNRLVVDGVSQPHEWIYSQRLSDWVLKLCPDAAEALRIAARGQHVERWTIPRNRYPMDRGGYLRWREELKRFHANTVTGFMREAGYAEDAQERVRSIILKKNLAGDRDVQTIEDALCLVFLETQFGELLAKTPHAKMVDIVRKTWKKMGDKGREAALGLTFSDEQKRILEQAIQ